MRSFITSLSFIFLLSHSTFAHDGPDPLSRWSFNAKSIVKKSGQPSIIKAKLGPTGTILGDHQIIHDDESESLYLSGRGSGIEVAKDYSSVKEILPTEAITVSALVSIDTPLRWGGIIGVIQDNGEKEAGWILGYDEEHFNFALRGVDGTGQLTYLTAKSSYKTGRIYYVVGIYDGKKMQLYVNGKLEAESSLQQGKIQYPPNAPYMIGAYRDDNEFNSLRGRVSEVAVYNHAAKAKWVEHAFSHYASLTKKEPVANHDPVQFVIKPYLQFGTQTGMTVMWRTSKPSLATLRYGENVKCEKEITSSQPALIHEIRIKDLKPETQYFYITESRAKAGAAPLVSEVSTFQTAVKPETPFAFAVISDTQGNPTVSGQLAQYAWGQRPSFLLHPGDLVSTGKNDKHWTDHFFSSMNPLIRYVPFYPVLGNHEQDAKFYYDYVSLPDPEYYFDFTFGNTHFFMIDSNRNVDPKSEQYQWLEKKLAESKAVWKIVCHHHPPFSSDENDYGNLWKTNQSSRGDARVRKLVPLYEKYHVDIVWNGHIHSYERTWPIRNQKAVEEGAPIYMITGGGGGGLETPGPVRPFFQNTVRRGHHYSMVRINGKRLELQVYDLDNRLFDSLTIKKKD